MYLSFQIVNHCTFQVSPWICSKRTSLSFLSVLLRLPRRCVGFLRGQDRVRTCKWDTYLSEFHHLKVVKVCVYPISPLDHIIDILKRHASRIPHDNLTFQVSRFLFENNLRLSSALRVLPRTNIEHYHLIVLIHQLQYKYTNKFLFFQIRFYFFYYILFLFSNKFVRTRTHITITWVTSCS